MIEKLPTKKREPSKFWKNQKFLMIGPGKIGKSDFWSRGPQTLFLEFEPGLNHLSVISIPIREWSDYQDAYGLLYTESMEHEGKLPYDTCVIDTIDRMVNLATEECIRRGREKYAKMASQINTIGDIPNGAGWAWQTDLIHTSLRKFEQLPMATVLIGHWTNRIIKEPTREYSRDTISIGGQTGTKLLHWADHTINMRARMVGSQISRVAVARPTDTLEAGSRGNVLPPEAEWGEDMDQNYDTMRKLFD